MIDLETVVHSPGLMYQNGQWGHLFILCCFYNIKRQPRVDSAESFFFLKALHSLNLCFGDCRCCHLNHCRLCVLSSAFFPLCLIQQPKTKICLEECAAVIWGIGESTRQRTPARKVHAHWPCLWHSGQINKSLNSNIDLLNRSGNGRGWEGGEEWTENKRLPGRAVIVINRSSQRAPCSSTEWQELEGSVRAGSWRWAF